MGLVLFLTKILHSKFLEEVYCGENCSPGPPASSQKKSGLCHSYGMPALIRQLISNVRRIPCIILAVIDLDSSQAALAYDVPHVINSFPVFCIHYTMGKGLLSSPFFNFSKNF
jgi:hypothetical protein